jgi:SMI1-KNR4 cell-wall
MSKKFNADFPVSPEKEKKINEIEKLMSACLPEWLKELLMLDGKVLFTTKLFIRKVDDSFEQEVSVESVFTADEILKTMEYVCDEYDITTNKLLIFGETLGSAIIGVSLGSSNYGNIYIYDWDFGLTLLADSFDSFLESLY